MGIRNQFELRSSHRPRFGQAVYKQGKKGASWPLAESALPQEKTDSIPAPTEKLPFKQRFKKWVRDGMPLNKLTEKNKRGPGKTMLWCGKWAVGLFVGAYGTTLLGSEGVDRFVGDGPIPAMVALDQAARNELRQNSTKEMNMRVGKTGEIPSAAELRQALEPVVLKHLKTLNPSAYEWVIDRFDKGKVTFESHGHDAHAAEYQPFSGTLEFGGVFLATGDGDKIAILCHEFRHSLQNWGKRSKEILLPQRIYMSYYEKTHPNLKSGEDGYGSIIEDEAHLYELEAYKKMGIAPAETLDYLITRKFFTREEADKLVLEIDKDNGYDPNKTVAPSVQPQLQFVSPTTHPPVRRLPGPPQTPMPKEKPPITRTPSSAPVGSVAIAE